MRKKRGAYGTHGGRPTRSAEVKLMIEAHADSDACLQWPHKIHTQGYGVCHYAGREWRVHRLAYLIVHGELPDEARILHRCDNPPCFNPKHLFSGTQTENLLDMRAKGRGSHGINLNPLTKKLTNEKVIEIRERYEKGGVTQQTLAAEFGISQNGISGIVRRRTWNYITEQLPDNL